MSGPRGKSSGLRSPGRRLILGLGPSPGRRQRLGLGRSLSHGRNLLSNRTLGHNRALSRSRGRLYTGACLLRNVRSK